MSEKWVKLADALLDLSSDGRLDWKETAATTAFITRVRPYTIELSEEELNGGRRCDYRFRVYSTEGALVDEFTDSDLASVRPENWEAKIRKLFLNIKRQVSGAELALDAILEQLAKKRLDDEIPF